MSTINCTLFQMFSGIPPFQNFWDYQVMLAVRGGERPVRPSDERSQDRGLIDEVWHIIETCWAQEPLQRPTASQIADQLRGLPDQPTDERPIDNFNNSFPSQDLRGQLNLPFSTLATSIVN